MELCDICEEKLTNNSIKLERCECELGRQISTLIEKNIEISKFKDSITTVENKLKKSEMEKEETQAKYLIQKKEVESCQRDLNNLNTTLQSISDSCNGFVSGIRQIKLPGESLFIVLYDCQTAGSEWIVIQQRIGGMENFNRNWTSYREGFGSFDSDFFLGLEKIHKLTSSQRYELYVHLQFAQEGIQYARYDDFKVGGEDTDYQLISLGQFSGNVQNDRMRYHEHKKFSTFDRYNNKASGHCAVEDTAGWWFGDCTRCDLNAPYGKYLYWDSFGYGMKLIEVKMLIRPKPV